MNMLAKQKIFFTLITLATVVLVIFCFNLKENINMKTEQQIFYERFKFSADLFKLNGNFCASIQRDEFANLINTNQPTLEIGPFSRPITGKNVKYFDVVDSKGLQNKADLYSTDGKRIPKINQIYNLLNENGKYFLVIPDKRYCFDHFVSESVLSDVLSSHFVKTKRHTLKTQLTMCETTHNDADRHWAGNHGDQLESESRSLECYIKSVNDFFATDTYIDLHQWRFFPKNFVHICNSLYKMGLIKLKIENIYCTKKNTLEFMAILYK